MKNNKYMEVLILDKIIGLLNDARKKLGKTDLGIRTEYLEQGGATHITADEEHLLLKVGDREGEVGGYNALSYSGNVTRHN